MTLKIGQTVRIKNSSTEATITNIANGVYKLSGSRQSFQSRDLEIPKVPHQIKRCSRIKQVSEDLGILKKAYARIRLEWLPNNRTCVAQFPCCTGKATEIHHMYKRTGWWLIIVRYFMPICRPCHKYATKNSREAIEKGVSISRNSANEPLLEFTDYEKNILKTLKIEIPSKISAI